MDKEIVMKRTKQYQVKFIVTDEQRAWKPQCKVHASSWDQAQKKAKSMVKDMFDGNEYRIELTDTVLVR